MITNKSTNNCCLFVVREGGIILIVQKEINFIRMTGKRVKKTRVTNIANQIICIKETFNLKLI